MFVLISFMGGGGGGRGGGCTPFRRIQTCDFQKLFMYLSFITLSSSLFALNGFELISCFRDSKNDI